jgi:hypothetical protein
VQIYLKSLRAQIAANKYYKNICQINGSFVQAPAIMPVRVFYCTNKFENKKEEGLIKQNCPISP